MSDLKAPVPFQRYLKTAQDEKEKSKTRSVNLLEKHIQFVNALDLNLSKIVRERIDEMIQLHEANGPPSLEKIK